MDESSELVVRAELVNMQQQARATMHRGVVLIALVPLVISATIIAAFALHGIGSLVSVLVGLSYTLIGGIAGIATIIGGAAEHRRASRELKTLDEFRKLPEARVIVR